MEREQIFDLLAAAGVVKVELEFSGGGDEGNVDEITATVKDADALFEYDLDNVPLLVAKQEEWESEFDIERFAEALEEPINDNFGGFDGPGVAGRLEWNVETRKVLLNYSREEWVDQDEEEV